jgi:hypothetical protein
MSQKDLREKFRPSLFTQNIHQVENYDPNYMYKNVIFTYKADPGRVDRYFNEGWEIVETTSPTIDDRSFTPNSKETKLRPQPCVTKTTDKHEQVLMRILKSEWEKNQLDKKNQREMLRLREAQRRGDKIVKRGNEVITTGSELNEL